MAEPFESRKMRLLRRNPWIIWFAAVPLLAGLGMKRAMAWIDGREP